MTLREFALSFLFPLAISLSFYPLHSWLRRRELERVKKTSNRLISDLLGFIVKKHGIPDWQMHQTLREFQEQARRKNGMSSV